MDRLTPPDCRALGFSNRTPKVRDVIKLVTMDGWRFVGHEGSHRQYKHPTKPGKVNSRASFRRGCARDIEQHTQASGPEEMKDAVIYEKTSTGYSAYVPDLPGCIATGRTLEVTKKRMEKAIAMHLDAMRADGDPIPEPTTLADHVKIPG